MSTFRFEYKNGEGKRCLCYVTATFEHDAWIMALKSCGWDNRTSLINTNESGYTIKNWWQKCPELGFNERDRQYFIRSKELQNNRKHALWSLSFIKSSLY